MVVEPDLHYDRPDVHGEIGNEDSEETQLGAAPLTDALQVEDETKTEAADNAKEGRDER